MLTQKSRVVAGLEAEHTPGLPERLLARGSEHRLLSGIIVMMVSETAKRSAAFGALLASLPIVSILSMIWLYRETKDTARIAAHSEATFWYVLPSLPLFLILPRLLQYGFGFYVSLLICCAITVCLYGLMVSVLPKFGVRF